VLFEKRPAVVVISLVDLLEDETQGSCSPSLVWPYLTCLPYLRYPLHPGWTI